MMKEEFIARTGFEPMNDEYAEIEKAYYEFEGDKDAFCKEFMKEGKDKAFYKARVAKIAAMERNHEEDINLLKSAIKKLERELELANAQIDREQEWRLAEDAHNVKQEDYEQLAKYYPAMSDEEALDWVVQETDFARERITILHEVPEFEVNRHYQRRRTGRMIDRHPVYCATDYHYILFQVRANVCHWYEMWKDEARPYYG